MCIRDSLCSVLGDEGIGIRCRPCRTGGVSGGIRSRGLPVRPCEHPVRQRQFLDVVDESLAHERFDAACAHLQPKTETISLTAALGRILAGSVVAGVDVPAFDRSNVDGYAVRAQNTFGAEELAPIALAVSDVSLGAGQAPLSCTEGDVGDRK